MTSFVVNEVSICVKQIPNRPDMYRCDLNIFLIGSNSQKNLCNSEHRCIKNSVCASSDSIDSADWSPKMRHGITLKDNAKYSGNPRS